MLGQIFFPSEVKKRLKETKCFGLALLRQGRDEALVKYPARAVDVTKGTADTGRAEYLSLLSSTDRLS